MESTCFTTSRGGNDDAVLWAGEEGSSILGLRLHPIIKLIHCKDELKRGCSSGTMLLVSLIPQHLRGAGGEKKQTGTRTMKDLKKVPGTTD